MPRIVVANRASFASANRRRRGKVRVHIRVGVEGKTASHEVDGTLSGVGYAHLLGTAGSVALLLNAYRFDTRAMTGRVPAVSKVRVQSSGTVTGV